MSACCGAKIDAGQEVKLIQTVPRALAMSCAGPQPPEKRKGGEAMRPRLSLSSVRVRLALWNVGVLAFVLVGLGMIFCVAMRANIKRGNQPPAQ